MTRIWPGISFFFAVFIDRDEVGVHKHAQKERGQYHPAMLTEQASSIKDCYTITWYLVGIFLRVTAEVSSG